MKDKTLHLVEDLLAGGLAVLMGIYLCACWAEAAPPEPTKGELVEAYYGEGLRVPGSGRGVEAPPPTQVVKTVSHTQRRRVDGAPCDKRPFPNGAQALTANGGAVSCQRPILANGPVNRTL